MLWNVLAKTLTKTFNFRGMRYTGCLSESSQALRRILCQKSSEENAGPQVIAVR
jgi:hypothetical protein